MTRNIGKDQKGIGDNGKRDKQEKEKLQKQLGRKKKKLNKKNQKLGNRQKKTKMKQTIQLTPTMDYRSSERGTLREKQCYNSAKWLNYYFFFFSFYFHLRN